MTATVSPALPVGRALSVTADGLLVIVAAANAPVVDLQGPWVITVYG